MDENNPEQLAERIIELLTNDALRQQVGAKLLKRAQRVAELGRDCGADAGNLPAVNRKESLRQGVISLLLG